MLNVRVERTARGRTGAPPARRTSLRLRRAVRASRGPLNADVRPNVNNLRIIAVLVTLNATFVAHATPLCPVPPADDSSEAPWRISEETFTESAARQELTKLEALLGPAGLAVDAVAWATSFVYIEGWYLKRQAQEAIARGEPEPFLSDFCEFMRERAYVRH